MIALFAATLEGCAPIATVAGQDTDKIQGHAPSYGPAGLNRMNNAHAVAKRIWVPDLDIGFDAQGIAVAGDQLLVSGYRSLSEKEHSGACWVVRVEAATGKANGRLQIPSPCRHAGGIAVAPDGTIWVSDTNSLFAIAEEGAFDGSPVIRRVTLANGLNGAFITAGAGDLWIGTYNEKVAGTLYAFDPATLMALADGQSLDPSAAKRALPTVRYAQGAAFDPDGKRLWIARSDINWGAIDELDAATGRLIRSHDVAAATEGIAFGDNGQLWAVSEAGVRHYYGSLLMQMALPFYPIIFQLRPTKFK